MKTLSALKYYFRSLPTLVLKTNFWKIPLLLTKKPILFKIPNYKFYVNNLMDIWTIKEVILDHGYEKYRKVRKGDIVIDIGASLGDYSIYAAKKASHVYAVEMNKDSIKLMKKNIDINKTKKITIISKQLKSLDHLFDQYKINRCDFLKVDCEGNEYEIFHNVSILTLTKIKHIAFEIHLFNQEMKKNYQQLKKLLSKNDFILKEEENPVYSDLKFLFAAKKL